MSAHETRSDSSAPEFGIRTLIVDDDPAVLRLHSAYVNEVPGFTVVGAVRTGAEGARRAADNNVDLVLLDMNLPDFSGIEVLHRLRMLREWGVDVLVISSARDGFTVRQALAASIFGYLVKPFPKEALVARLEEYRRARQSRPTETLVGLAQGEIDRLIRPMTGAVPAVAPPGERPGENPLSDLPKGLAVSTMQTVLAALHPTAPVSAKAISASSGASRATVRRYLDYLTESGFVTVSHRFGARGRPEILYRRASAPIHGPIA